MFQNGVKRLMVYAHALVRNFIVRHIEPLRQHFDGVLYAVAQSRHFHARIFLHGSAQHRHGVCIIQKNGARTIFFDVAAYIQHERNIAKRSENARYAARVAYVDVDAILFGNDDVVFPHVDIAVKDGAQHAVGAL